MTAPMARAAAILVLSAFCAIPASAQDASAGGPPQLAKDLAPARTGTRLNVSSSAISLGLPLGIRYTQDGENASIPVAWTKGPPGTRSYAILVEDASVDRPEPIAHWVAYDIPSTMTRMGANRPKEANAGGFLQGLNVRNEVGYVGPKPPPGETHYYHVQVFALNTRITLDPAETDRNDIVEAMKGHVLASGEIVVGYPGG